MCFMCTFLVAKVSVEGKAHTINEMRNDAWKKLQSDRTSKLIVVKHPSRSVTTKSLCAGLLRKFAEEDKGSIFVCVSTISGRKDFCVKTRKVLQPNKLEGVKPFSKKLQSINL